MKELKTERKKGNRYKAKDLSKTTVKDIYGPKIPLINLQNSSQYKRKK
jgi:hypothetical protein